MQLTPLLAQPPASAQAGLPQFLSILTTLRGPRPPASAAAPAAAPPAAAPVAVSPASAAVEASQPSIGQKLLGGVAENQNKYLANQQALAVISAGIGARFSLIAQHVWSQLRGTEPQAAPEQSPPAEAPPAG
ncbi:MAG: hypothetical protein JWL76_635 [Thermoleophilia bacterium]|nr:hypothetical protein [Thermoleophilia bacterium]